MSSGAVEREAAYYQEIEGFFVARRGPPLVISNADWTLVRRWRRAGIPLRIVLRGIQDALDVHAHSFQRREPVGSLRYCEAEVAAAHERWRRALAGAGSDDADARAALEARAQACASAAERLEPTLRACLVTLAEALRARAADPGTRLDLLTWLAAEEAALVKRLRRAAGKEALARVEAEVDAELEPYRARLPERVLAQVRAESIARRLLEERGLPRLGL